MGKLPLRMILVSIILLMTGMAHLAAQPSSVNGDSGVAKKLAQSAPLPVDHDSMWAREMMPRLDKEPPATEKEIQLIIKYCAEDREIWSKAIETSDCSEQKKFEAKIQGEGLSPGRLRLLSWVMASWLWMVEEVSPEELTNMPEEIALIVNLIDSDLRDKYGQIFIETCFRY